MLPVNAYPHTPVTPPFDAEGERLVPVLNVVRNPDLDEALERALREVWAAVSNAGGAVGFLPGVTAEDVRLFGDPEFERVRQGRDDLVVAFEEDEPVGFGFLVTNEFPLAAHWATIKRLQRHPHRRGRGVGAAVLAELEAAAVDRGLERVVLTVRGGTGRERFYTAHGYRLDARLPGRLKVAGGVVVDDLHLSKELTGPAAGHGPGLPLQRLDATLPVPTYAHPGDAGLDLYAREDVELEPGQRAVVPTGVAVAIPQGWVGLVHPRSGLAARAGVGIVNAPGTIDAGYRGEIRVVLVNHDRDEPVKLSRGERIAQLLIQPVGRVDVIEVDELPASPRGDGGFGSTGR